MKKIYAALIILLIFVIVLLSQNKEDLSIYQTDIQSHDIHILDLTLVNADNKLYIPKNYTFKKLFDNDIQRLRIELSYNDKYIYDWGIEMDHLDEIKIDNDVLIDNVKLNKEDSITFKINYLKNGEEVKLEEVVELNNIMRNSDAD